MLNYFNNHRITSKLIVISTLLLASTSSNAQNTRPNNQRADTTNQIALSNTQIRQNRQNSTNTPNNQNNQNNDNTDVNETDEVLRNIINNFNLAESPTENRELPDISSNLAQLGKKLFFSKSLSGDLSTACASCHHPTLGGSDNLSLSIGVDSTNNNVLGIGREHINGQPLVPRNTPTIFNIALWDSGLFWDSRVESLGKENNQNGAASGISTPDSGFGNIDVNAGNNLVTAQARFPVTSSVEMKTDNFEANGTNQAIRSHLAARIGDFGVGMSELSLNQWLSEFQNAFQSTDDADTLINFNNIGHAIAEYQRSMVFVNSPWQSYVNGDITALNEQQKQGAVLFFTPPQIGGAGCANCHNGPTFSDENHHTIGFPQIGPGKGFGNTGDDDFGRAGISGDNNERYGFRTPSLLNVAVTAPYTHSGAYQTLDQVLRHYDNPRREVNDYIDEQAWCRLPQFINIANCADLYPNVGTNSTNAISKLRNDQRTGVSVLQNINLNNRERAQLINFLESLTDPCVESRECLAPWIADSVTDNPDGQVLIATDVNGQAL